MDSAYRHTIEGFVREFAECVSVTLWSTLIFCVVDVLVTMCNKLLDLFNNKMNDDAFFLTYTTTLF